MWIYEKKLQYPVNIKNPNPKLAGVEPLRGLIVSISRKSLPKPGVPESFKVLQKELQALAIDINVYDVDGEVIDMKASTKYQEREERRLADTIKEQFSDFVAIDDETEALMDDYDDEDYE